MPRPFPIPIERLVLCASFFFLTLGLGRLNAQLLPFHAYTTKDGLISNWATAIIQDSAGHLWIGTNEGLSVYDGAAFTNYTTLDGLSNNFVTTLLEDKLQPGTIWIGTIQHGLTKYCDGKLSKVLIGTTPLTNNVISMAEDEHGVLWLGTSSGVFRVHRDSVVSFSPDRKFNNTVMLTSTPANVIWMATTTDLLVCHSNGEHIASPHFSLQRKEFIDWISSDRDGSVWVGTSNGKVMLFQDTTLLCTRRLPKRTYGILLDRNGFVWFNTMEEVLKIRKTDFSNGPIVHYGLGRGMPEASTWPVLEDREGNMWFQTFNNGVVKLPDMSLQRFPVDAFTSATALDTLGHVWAVDKNGLLEMWKQSDEEWFSFHHIRTTLSINRPATSLVFDAHSRLCLVQSNGSVQLYSIVHKRNSSSYMKLRKQLEVDGGTFRGPILTVRIDRQNRMWCSIEGAGVFIMDMNMAGRQLAVLRFPNDLPIKSVRAIFQDRKGDMWLGDYNAGLVCLPGSDWTNKKIRHFTTKDGLPDDGIRSFGEDLQGRLWVGTRYGGVAIYDGHNFQNLSIKDGLISNSIWDIARDSVGRMWLGTGSGLMFVNADNLHQFGLTDELIGSGADFCAATREGLIWFGKGGTHLSAFDPGKLLQNGVPPPVYITNITMNDSTVSKTERQEFSSDRNNCTIQYIGIILRDERNVQYQYRLNSEHWCRPTKQRTVSFAALPPGSYAFQVRAINSAGIVSIKPATFAFTIVPPFWKRWWFLVITACLFAVLVYSAYLYRVRELLRVERFRTRISTDLHDDIGASLTRIALFSDLAKDEARSLSPRLSGIADRIGNDARELLEAVSTLVWSIDPRHDRLEEVLIYMKEFAQEMFDMKNIGYEFVADDTLAHLILPVEKRRNFLLLFKESINNVVQHSACTNARIEIGLSGKILRLSLEDNGAGFTRDAHPIGHGISNMQARAEAAHGSVTIKSILGKGTRVDVLIPVE